MKCALSKPFSQLLPGLHPQLWMIGPLRFEGINLDVCLWAWAPALWVKVQPSCPCRLYLVTQQRVAQVGPQEAILYLEITSITKKDPHP